MSYRGEIGSLQESNKGAVGSYPSQFTPGSSGGYGVFPAYLGDQFPEPNLAFFNSIKGAKYKNVDPFDFAAKYGDFSRGEISKNFSQASNMASNALNSELANLKSYVPAASALKRSETSADNIFNQQQRTAQINSALPGATEALSAQAERAASYAEGRLPSGIEDSALELGLRSRSADQSAAGGFGARSSVARKASDLMSAEQRLQIAQYGEGLTASNINQRQGLLLAPTEYSNAGSQVNVNPSLSSTQLTSSYLGDINQNSLVPASTAFQAQIGQNQFTAGLQQQTQQFNASNNFAESQFNAGVKNQFAMAKFGYNVGYAGAVAGAAQTDVNTELALQQQQQYQNQVNQSASQVRSTNEVESIAGTVATVGSVLGNLFGLGGAGTLGAFSGGSSGSGAGSSGGSSGGGGGSFDPSLPSVDSNGNVTIPPFSYGAGGETPSYGGQGSTTPSFDFGSGGGSGGGGSTGLEPDGGFLNYNQSVGDSGGGYAISRSFAQDTGLSNEAVTRSVLTQGAGTLAGAGITYHPGNETQPIGNDSTGRPLYGSIPLLKSTDTNTGSSLVTGLQAVLDPMHALTSEDSTALQKVATVAGDVSLISTLTAQQQAGDTKGFINTLLGRVGQPTINSLTDDPKIRSGVGSVFSAYQLAQNWDSMSPAQKSLGVASLGLQGFKSATGKNLAEVPLVKPTLGADGKVSVPGLTVGQGLSLFQAGYNTYSLVKNWDQLNALQKIAMGTGDAVQIANVAKSFGLMGSGVTGAAVPGITAESLQATNWALSPNLGVGAITSQTGADLPAGYTVLSRGAEGTVAAPTANISSQAVAQEGSLLNTAGGVAGITLGAYQVYKGWGAGGTSGAINGALGGSAIAGGLYSLGATNPYLLAGVVAYSIAADTVGERTVAGKALKAGTPGATGVGSVVAGPIGMAYDAGKAVLSYTQSGKSHEQGQRDDVRARFKDVGIADKDYNVTLANGEQVNIGTDGHGGQHSVYDSSKLTKEQGSVKTLNSWDTDYTNDLDYSAGMMGNALSRLTNGRKGTDVDQLGGQLGNAFLGKDGFGKGYTGDNFSKVAANARAVAAQAGIKSKADAYQLANQAYAEGRINESDLTAAHQAFNMMYDKDGYQTGQKLMSGRFRGIEVATTTPSNSQSNSKEEPAKKSSTPSKTPASTSASGAGSLLGDIKGLDNSRSSSAGQSNRAVAPSKQKEESASSSKKAETIKSEVSRRGNLIPLLSRSKEDVRANNRARYANQVA